MARPIKQGLEYYPADVDMYSDNKINFVSAIFELEGEAIIYRLLACIYRNGFYANWSEDEVMLFASKLPARKPINELIATVNGVVDELIKRDFFDKELFDMYKILTSKGIQRRYFTGIEKRTCINIDYRYWLLKDEKSYYRDSMHFFNTNSLDDEVYSSTKEINGGNNSYNKEKKKKENKNRENKVTNEESKTINFKQLVDIFNSTCVNLSKVKIITEKRKSALKQIFCELDYKQDEWASFCKKVYDSDFLSGRNGKWTSCSFDWIINKGNFIKIIEGNYDNKETFDVKKNRFVNYEQREWDFEKLDKMEQELIDKELNSFL